MRKNTRKTDIIIIAVIILLIAGGVLFALFKNNNGGLSSGDASHKETTLSDLNGRRAGMLTGSFVDKVIESKFPESQIYEYNNYVDLLTALETDRVDYFIRLAESAQLLINERPELTYLDVPVETIYIGALFAKTSGSDKLRGMLDEFITKIRSDGTLDEMYKYWKGDDADEKYVEMSGMDAANGTIRLACNTEDPPMCFISDGKYAGVEPDIMVRFCREYGYGLEIINVDAPGMIPGVVSGMYDVAMGNIVITDERKESVNFSVPYNSGDLVAVIKKDTGTSAGRLVPEVTLDKLNSPDRSVGVGAGSAGMFAAERYLPDAKEVYCNDPVNAYESLKQGMIDAYVYDRSQMQLALENGLQGLMLLDENIGEPTDVAVGLSRVSEIPGLKNSIDKFITEKKADGTLDEMYKRWVVDKNYKMPEIKAASSPEFTLVVGTTGVTEPYNFYAGSTVTGYDIELAKRFAAWLNADISIKVYDYSGVVTALQTGDVDCAFANLNVTEERKEIIDFSVPVITIENGIMVRTAFVDDAGPSWFDSVISSFEKNFIREERWKLIVEGVGTTCLITAASALFGTLLAFLICMFRRTGSRLANAISDIYVRLLQGTPMVVLLMILYYVIFGKSGLEAVWVAIIGFSMNFGAYASEIMRSGIDSIDGGQREAALALGYSENQAFFRFIFPQAAVHFMPVYRQEIVSLLKSTSIVGYIAIQDLTKMSDIIRSRTYEAFFPLIVTAVIYFILAWIVSLILKTVMRGFDHRKSAGKDDTI